ncbi:MAG: hypothetical protein AB8H47_17790 [Bacteroidia bacterium]
MPILLSDRIVALAALPNAQFSPSEADHWLADALEQLAKDGFVLAEMQKTLSVDEHSPAVAQSPPSKWRAVNLSKELPKKRKIIIKGRK